MNNKGLSPLLATIMLVVFALIIGTITMNWGKGYIGKLGEAEGKTIVISPQEIDTPLKQLQIEYITGEITEEEYFAREKELFNGG
ncbi:MAG TPA: hypothetical protein VFF28_07140 [Candidatus Nanoarchaeia archaeon]|nr:hypothetical protein [Candidatus Nanoarchaeia archaeon]